MIKKGVSYGGGNIPSAIWLFLEDTMTAVIQVKNENGAVLCSDTWNHGSDNHYIQKIFFNKENHIMIAQIGTNGVYLNNGVWLVSDILQSFCDSFNINKKDEHIKYMQQEIQKLLDIVRLDLNHTENFIQYILVYYDNENKIHTEFYQYLCKLNVDGIIKDEQKLDKSKINEYCFYAGVNMTHQNKTFNLMHFPNKSLIDLKEYATEFIGSKIQEDSNKSNEDRLIGGKIHYVTMDINGNIETNIERITDTI